MVDLVIDQIFETKLGDSMFETIYSFIFKLRLQIKIMSHDDFIKLLDKCDYQQLIYALYFRYC